MRAVFEESFKTTLPKTLNSTTLVNYYRTTDIPKMYLEDEEQKVMDFAYIPDSVKSNRCMNVQPRDQKLARSYLEVFTNFKIPEFDP